MTFQMPFCNDVSNAVLQTTLYNEVFNDALQWRACHKSHTHTMAQSWDLKHKIIWIQPSSDGPFYSLAQIHFESVNIILSRKGYFKSAMIETTVIMCHPKM